MRSHPNRTIIMYGSIIIIVFFFQVFSYLNITIPYVFDYIYEFYFIMNMNPSLMVIVSFFLMSCNISIDSTSEWEIRSQSVKFPNF